MIVAPDKEEGCASRIDAAAWDGFFERGLGGVAANVSLRFVLLRVPRVASDSLDLVGEVAGIGRGFS